MVLYALHINKQMQMNIKKILLILTINLFFLDLSGQDSNTHNALVRQINLLNEQNSTKNNYTVARYSINSYQKQGLIDATDAQNLKRLCDIKYLSCLSYHISNFCRNNCQISSSKHDEISQLSRDVSELKFDPHDTLNRLINELELMISHFYAIDNYIPKVNEYVTNYRSDSIKTTTFQKYDSVYLQYANEMKNSCFQRKLPSLSQLLFRHSEQERLIKNDSENKYYLCDCNCKDKYDKFNYYARQCDLLKRSKKERFVKDLQDTVQINNYINKEKYDYFTSVTYSAKIRSFLYCRDNRNLITYLNHMLDNIKSHQTLDSLFTADMTNDQTQYKCKCNCSKYAANAFYMDSCLAVRKDADLKIQNSITDINNKISGALIEADKNECIKNLKSMEGCSTSADRNKEITDLLGKVNSIVIKK
jgi:hypothetical protein